MKCVSIHFNNLHQGLYLSLEFSTGRPGAFLFREFLVALGFVTVRGDVLYAVIYSHW